MIERFKVGFIYKTKGGGSFRVVGESTKYVGYETVHNQYGNHRYNRSIHNSDNGRTTGSEWTDNCLVYPPVIVGKMNPVTVHLLNAFASLCSLYKDIKWKIEYKFM